MNEQSDATGGDERLHTLYRFEAHAIVSADDMIAGADGAMPPTLSHPGDWARFQAALDRANAIVLGRKSHQAKIDHRQGKRIVMSHQVGGLERRDDALWWNPAGASLEEALSLVAPRGGLVAIPGGREVFDYFLDIGLDAFHLSRVEGLRLPGGIPVFSACRPGNSAEAILDAAGLRPREHEAFDAEAGVSVTVWRKWRR